MRSSTTGHRSARTKRTRITAALALAALVAGSAPLGATATAGAARVGSVADLRASGPVASAEPLNLGPGDHVPYIATATTTWVDLAGRWIVGQVVNDSPERIGAVTVEVNLYDAANTVLGTTSSYTSSPEIAPGASSGFLLPVIDDAALDHYVITGTYSTSSPPIAGGGMSITPGATVDQIYEGQVRNLSAETVTETAVMVTYFDASGTVVFVTEGWYTTPNTLAPGDVATFSVVIPAERVATATRVLTQVRSVAVSSGVTVSSWDLAFDDLYQSIYRTDILWLANAGITRGCSGNEYCPWATVTRGQMASFLARALNLPPSPSDYFVDDAGSTFEADINRLAYAGLTNGCAEQMYCPAAPVLRGQMASFLVRALELTAGASVDAFSDDNGTTHEQNINRLAYAGLTNGCASGIFCPNAAVTRGQMAAFLRRAFVP